MFQICGDVEVVGFPVQNVYKMTSGDENATFEPLNLWTSEPLNPWTVIVQKHKGQISNFYFLISTFRERLLFLNGDLVLF